MNPIPANFEPNSRLIAGARAPIACQSCSKTFTKRGEYKYVPLTQAQTSPSADRVLAAAIRKLTRAHTGAMTAAQALDCEAISTDTGPPMRWFTNDFIVNGQGVGSKEAHGRIT